MDIKLPNLGDGVDTATVVSILVKPGDSIRFEQTILELETDKAVSPIPAPMDGVIEAILIKEGDVVRTGTAVFRLVGNGTSPGAPVASAVPVAVAPIHAVPVATASSTPSFVPTAGVVVAVQVGPFTGAASPTIRLSALRFGIDLNRIQGTGSGGRIMESDVRSYVAYLQSLSAQPAAAPTVANPEKPKGVLPDFSKWGSIERKSVTSLRKKIGDKMVESWIQVPHVTQFDEADITDLMAIRKKFATAYEQKGAKLTVSGIALKLVAETLKAFPNFNSTYDVENGELILKNYVHLGVAVDTETGLIVPVIRDVDQKSVLEISIELGKLAEKARNRQLQLDELQGGSFTVSNLGGLGVAHFTPIVNTPQVAILGLSKAIAKPVVREGEITIRTTMPISLSYDHRVIDGADGARFVRHLITQFESVADSLLAI